MKNKILIAKLLFSNSANCCQSTLAAFADDLGLTQLQALSLGSGFGGGMCQQGKTCGAVTGAYMALGMISSKKFTLAPELKENTYRLMDNFNQKFINNNGSLECKTLLGHDISTPQGKEAALSKDLFSTLCPRLVENAVEIVEQIIAESSNH